MVNSVSITSYHQRLLEIIFHILWSINLNMSSFFILTPLFSNTPLPPPEVHFPECHFIDLVSKTIVRLVVLQKACLVSQGSLSCVLWMLVSWKVFQCRSMSHVGWQRWCIPAEIDDCDFHTGKQSAMAGGCVAMEVCSIWNQRNGTEYNILVHFLWNTFFSIQH